MRVNSRGCIQGPGLYVFFRDHSSGEQTNKSRLRFSGAADVCLDPPNRSNSGWSVCMHVYIDKYAYVCACAGGGSACLCIAEQREEEGGGGGEGGESLSGVLSSAELGASGLSFTVCSCHNKQTMSKKLQQRVEKPRFPARRGSQVMITRYRGKQKSQETVHLRGLTVLSNAAD